MLNQNYTTSAKNKQANKTHTHTQTERDEKDTTIEPDLKQQMMS